MCATYITVCQDVYHLYTGLGDCVVRSLHACKYPGNVTKWWYLGVCKSGQSYARVDKVIQEWTKLYKRKRVDSYADCSYYVDILKCANVGRDIQRYTVLAHLISQRWLCSEETYTRRCHGFQFLSLWVKGERWVR